MPNMTLDEIYKRAEKAKPEFDSKLTKLAEKSGGVFQLTELKDQSRAIAKINARYNGDVSQIRDVLRGSIIVDTVSDVNKAFDLAKNSFTVDFSRNSYASLVHSSDGYFDAKLEIITNGIFAEIQIHTKAMIAAKEEAHILYEQRQTILRNAGKEISVEQRKQIMEINKQMRNIFRKVNL